MKKYMLAFAALSLIATTLPTLGEDGPLGLSLGTVKTEAEKSGMRLAVKYAEVLSQERFIANYNKDSGAGSLWDISPDITIETGDEDTFSSVQAKLTANYMRFDTVAAPGGKGRLPDMDKLVNVFPLSAGFETERNFRNVAGLLEVGYVPYMDIGRENDRYVLGVNPVIGIFLQGGYKAEVDSDSSTNAAPAASGSTDNSEEETDEAIARVKLSAAAVVDLFSFSGRSKTVALVGEANLWYDALNEETYDREVGAIRLFLTEDRSRSFDLKYEHGAGAPTFNSGEQFSANINMTF